MSQALVVLVLSLAPNDISDVVYQGNAQEHHTVIDEDVAIRTLG